MTINNQESRDIIWAQLEKILREHPDEIVRAMEATSAVYTTEGRILCNGLMSLHSQALTEATQAVEIDVRMSDLVDRAASMLCDGHGFDVTDKRKMILALAHISKYLDNVVRVTTVPQLGDVMAAESITDCQSE